ncbi:hypothetical protein UPYG_G00069850 [Umbra pygmaea]|uniref:Tetratricopeptide repeat domain 21B n=1 Tax=Umbra pygmaea TaxID=75934 RepID=A0ABD0XBC0_UMBPY
MADTDPVCLALLVYLMGEKSYRQAIVTAGEYLKIYSNDPILLFFKAFGILMEGRTQEAISELEEIRDQPAVSVCSPMALICAHKQSEMIDHGTLSVLEADIKRLHKTAGGKSLFYAALFLWLTGCGDKAKVYINKILVLSRSSKEALTLKGWVDMGSGDEVERNNAIRYLTGRTQDSWGVFRLMGKVKYFMDRHNFTESLEVVNQILASYSDFLPALTLKMRLFLALLDWEQSLDTASRILQKHMHDLKALQLVVLHSLVKSTDLMKAKEYLRNLISAAEISEPCSPSLHIRLTQPISRMCGSDPEIVQLLVPFVERASFKAPEDADVANEMGYLLMLQDRSKEASRWFNIALKADNSSAAAMAGTLYTMAGLIRCQLLEDQLEEAASQLEFFREIHLPNGQSPGLVLLQAILAHKRGAGLAVVSPLLKEASDLHFLHLRGQEMGPEYFYKLHPNFIFQVVNLHLSFQDKPLSAGQPIPFGLSQSRLLLEPVVTMAPGLLPGAYHMAQVHFLSGDTHLAQRFLDICLEGDPTIPEFHLLHARMHLYEEDYNQCFLSLEAGVSNNFQVCKLPQYHLIRARVLQAVGKLEEAIQTLRQAMGIPGVKTPAAGRPSFSNSERVSVFLELAEALRLHGQQHESAMLLQEATTFAGITEEIRVTFAKVDHALAGDDTATALSILSAITPNQAHYIEAREKMALIYLQRCKDKNLYMSCYRKIREELPSSRSTLLMGDAYMTIQEPERAIKVYQEAMKEKDQDATLARKMGQAYVKTHQFKQAVSHYESAVKLASHDSLVADLVELHLKLQQYDKAQKILTTALRCDDGTLKVSNLISNVQYLILLARAYNADQGSVQETLEKAYSVQTRILKHCEALRPDLLEQERHVLCSICLLLARHYRCRTEVEKSESYYNQAAKHCSDDNKCQVSLELSQFYLEVGKTDDALMQVQGVLGLDALHPDATMVFGDIKFKEHKLEESVEIYMRLMERCPDNFVFLAKCIQVLRWSGKLDYSLALFDACELYNRQVTTEPGYNYCKGLYYWHTYRVSEALFHLNKASRSKDWDQQALELMIRICLNPDHQVIGGKVFDPVQEWSLSEAELREQVGVATAQKLLKEFHPRQRYRGQRSPGVQGSERMMLLTNLCLMATGDPKHIQSALQAFTDLASTRVNNVPYLLAMGQAFMLLKQTPRARNQLKRLSKVEWRSELAEDLETARLLLADIYIQSGKYDIATDLLKHCLKYNQACSRAYEYMGYIREKEQLYRDAAVLYGHAWLHTNRVNPAMGFRLAFNYLKEKRYIEAIEVCHKVLTEHPHYPLIQTEPIVCSLWLCAVHQVGNYIEL